MADLVRFAILHGFKSQGGFAVDLKRPNRWRKDHVPMNFFAFTNRRAAGDRRLQARRAARAPQPACQGCARYCAVGVLDILRGCAARRSLPEGLIADLSLMITRHPMKILSVGFKQRPQYRGGRLDYIT